MPTLPFTRHVFADGFDGRESRMSRPAVIASVIAHVAVLYAASQWYETEPAQVATTFEWVTSIEPPSEPVVEPPPEIVQPPVPVVARAPPPGNAMPRAVSPPIVAPPQAETVTEALPAAPVGPSRFDLDAARRAAATATVEQHARDGNLRAPSIDDAPPPPVPVPKQPSIFVPQQHSGGGFLSPSKAHTIAGQRLGRWCNKISGGGFGFFGIPICASGTIEPPSGIFADSIPEYMKLKPECEGIKCRLVPKDPDE